MGYSNKVVAAARQRLQAEKQSFEAEQTAAREEIFLRAPRLREIERELRAGMAKTALTVFRGGDNTKEITALRDENLALQRERDSILWNLELEPDSLDEHPFCAACGGSGYKGSVMCECLAELCRQEQRRELSSLLSTGADRFEDFSLSWYSTERNADYGSSPRENMSRILESCKLYAKNFTTESGSLLFSGAPGLGKTMLSACIARVVTDRGFSVIYDTAVTVFSEFETIKFGTVSEEQRERVNRYYDCDLLILDDLGTEMATAFITSTLYTLINNRLMARRPTILSTNLSITEIARRYSEPVFSRLRGEYDYYFFFGKDIRALRRGML